MHQDKISTYFKNKGVDVLFNTLGHTTDLNYSFIADYKHIVSASQRKESNFVKISAYADMYTFEPRPKYTGFENFKKLDREFRTKISPFINESQFSPSLLIENSDVKSVEKGYKELLKNSLSKINEPILYLSGGLDSELVANALLEKGIKFKVVIFQHLDKNRKVCNLQDISYAFKFCKTHKIIPNIFNLDIESLWESEEFEKLAIETQFVSPQLVTYVHMINTVSAKYRNATHLFGGEVKFMTDYVKDNGELANVLLLEKVTPGYNNGSYGISAGCADFCEAQLLYYSNGTYDIEVGTGLSYYSVNSGNWYNGTPTSPFGYMARVSTINSLDTFNGGCSPTSAGTWLNISASGTGIVYAYATGAGFGQTNYGVINCVVECKETNNPSSGVFAQVEIYAASVCF